MRSVFTVDSKHEISITSDNPIKSGDPRSIAVAFRETTWIGEIGGVQTARDVSIEINLEPSHARAIASALLSAAKA